MPNCMHLWSDLKNTGDLCWEGGSFANTFRLLKIRMTNDGQGSLACCSPWGCKESDTTEQLNWTEVTQVLPRWLSGKEPACQYAGYVGSIPGLRRSPGGGNGHPLEYSCWEIPSTEEPGGVQPTVSQRVWHYWWIEDVCMTPFRIWPQPTFTALSSHCLPPCLLLGSLSVHLISLLLLLLGLHICCFQVYLVGTCQNEMGLFLVCSSDTS